MTEGPEDSSLQALIKLVNTRAALDKRKAALSNRTITHYTQDLGLLFGGRVMITVTFDERPESEKESD
jgi:hypothetical protein